MARTDRPRIPGVTLLLYMLIVEVIFTVLLFAVLVGSGKLDLLSAGQKAAILFGFFLIADAVVVVLTLTVARGLVSVIYPLQQGEYEGLHRRAQKHAEKREFPEAVAIYDEWIEEHPKDVEVRFELARLLRVRMKSPDRAVTALTEAIDMQPTRPWMVKLLEELADLYYTDLKSPARAASMYKVIAEYFPGTDDAVRAHRKAESLAVEP